MSSAKQGNPAYSPDNTFFYNRHDDEFEQVMAYYWVTEAQKYIQSLGFGSVYRPINMESQDIRINTWGLDNSYSWDKHDVLRFGKGGVDDAEDAEVILHEYGHAMQDSQATPFGNFGLSEEAGAIGEGFGDYWAVTVSNVIAPTPDPACVADWDSVSYTTSTPHCLRRVDLDLHYPEDLNGGVHHDGQIWSRALVGYPRCVRPYRSGYDHSGIPVRVMPQIRPCPQLPRWLWLQRTDCMARRKPSPYKQRSRHVASCHKT